MVMVDLKLRITWHHLGLHPGWDAWWGPCTHIYKLKLDIYIFRMCEKFKKPGIYPYSHWQTMYRDFTQTVTLVEDQFSYEVAVINPVPPCGPQINPPSSSFLYWRILNKCKYSMWPYGMKPFYITKEQTIKQLKRKIFLTNV